jgi:NADH:ubiquinone oxidoreductase subunit 5 (subunit L)/multisubunit Na+/H+ antiporter MnhA subunit
MVASEFISQGFQLPIPLTVLLFGGLIALVIGLLRERMKIPRIQEAWMVLVAVADLASVYLLYQEVKALPGEVLVMVLWGQSPPLGGCFEIDMLSVFMCGSIAVLGLLVAIYSVSYM